MIWKSKYAFKNEFANILSEEEDVSQKKELLWFGSAFC